jgi:hypothetical protein
LPLIFTIPPDKNRTHGLCLAGCARYHAALHDSSQVSLMNWNKILIGSLFAVMAIGGMGGMMLVGYSLILPSH